MACRKQSSPTRSKRHPLPSRPSRGRTFLPLGYDQRWLHTAAHSASRDSQQFPQHLLSFNRKEIGKKTPEKAEPGGQIQGRELYSVSLNCACDEVQRTVTCYSHSTLSRRPKEDNYFPRQMGTRGTETLLGKGVFSD